LVAFYRCSPVKGGARPSPSAIDTLDRLRAGCAAAAGERSIPALWDRIGAILHTFTPEECNNYFKHASYTENVKPCSWPINSDISAMQPMARPPAAVIDPVAKCA
jgi:hypothetical protein